MKPSTLVTLIFIISSTHFFAQTTNQPDPKDIITPKGQLLYPETISNLNSDSTFSPQKEISSSPIFKESNLKQEVFVAKNAEFITAKPKKYRYKTVTENSGEQLYIHNSEANDIIIAKKRVSFIEILDDSARPTASTTVSKNQFFYFIGYFEGNNFSESNIFSIDKIEEKKEITLSDIKNQFQEKQNFESHWLLGPFSSPKMAKNHQQAFIKEGLMNYFNFIGSHYFEYELKKEKVAKENMANEGGIKLSDITDFPTEASPNTTLNLSNETDYFKSKAEPFSLASSYGLFKITKNTSLRNKSESSAKVLKRLNEGTQVEVLEKTTKYWWKVNHKGKTGYVKALLLK